MTLINEFVYSSSVRFGGLNAAHMIADLPCFKFILILKNSALLPVKTVELVSV